MYRIEGMRKGIRSERLERGLHEKEEPQESTHVHFDLAKR